MTNDLHLELKRTADKAREYTEQRNWTIVKAHEEGMSYRQIADAVGLHFTSVANIVNRQTDK